MTVYRDRLLRYMRWLTSPRLLRYYTPSQARHTSYRKHPSSVPREVGEAGMWSKPEAPMIKKNPCGEKSFLLCDRSQMRSLAD